MKNHYELLGVATTADAGEIRHAFRREIARYHPDKVQHLGSEFREFADLRASQLTEAYRILMDAESRRMYDMTLGRVLARDSADSLRRPLDSVHAGGAGPASVSRATTFDGSGQQNSSERLHQQDAVTCGLIRKAAIEKLSNALMRLSGSAAAVAIAGFDVAYVITPRKALFKKTDGRVLLLARFVPKLDPGAVEEAWRLSRRSAPFDGAVCLMLLGSGARPVRELSAAIAGQRRRTQTPSRVVVPVDVRDWEALFPPDTPQVVRQVLDWLKTG